MYCGGPNNLKMNELAFPSIFHAVDKRISFIFSGHITLLLCVNWYFSGSWLGSNFARPSIMTCSIFLSENAATHCLRTLLFGCSEKIGIFFSLYDEGGVVSDFSLERQPLRI